eukprot:GEMP01027799.1.p1 GENE.GEMP01027799.1~~GEMP01027799.1.p1  ORF type:complete len:126 (+),score=5.91 GEMP01027799.1:56-433(+)
MEQKPDFKYNLTDIPNKWDKYNPEYPPYRFLGGRSRKDTMRLSIATLIGSWFIGYLSVRYFDRKQDESEEFWSRESARNMPIEAKQFTNRQNEAFRDIFLKARRERLGLKGSNHTSLDIKDPYDD